MQNDSIDNLRLDLNRDRVRGVIYVRSKDTKARTIHITLCDNGQVVDLSDAVFCEILMKKPDNRENDQTMVRYGNELQYTFRTQDVNVPGEVKCNVQVTFADEAVITSPEFSVMVFDRVMDQSHEQSENEYTALTQMYAEVRSLKAACDNDATRAENAEDNSVLLKDRCEECLAESEAIVASLDGTIMPQDGSVTFLQLDNVNMTPGYMYLVNESFTTDERFVEGEGIVMPAWTNVFIASDLSFVCMGGKNVVDDSYVHTDNNYTTEEKTKLSGIETGAEVNVQADYTQADSTADDFIKNKPTLGTAAAKDFTSQVTDQSADLVTSGAVKAAIDAAVSSIYKPAGDKTAAELTSSLLVASNLGKVFNITTTGTTTSDFVDGAGKTIQVGDNVAIVDIGSGTYKFDLLSGFVDLTGYYTKNEVDGLLSPITSAISGLQSSINDILAVLGYPYSPS